MDQGDEQVIGARTVRDWHWAMGLVGRILISLGLLIFAFVGYLLWGTSIEFNSNQGDLKNTFNETQSSLLAAQSTVAPTTVPVVTAPPTTSGPATTSGPSPSTPGTAPTTIAAPTTAPAPTLPPLALGDVVGALRMPSITSKTYYLVAGVRVEDLKKGVGHFPSSPLPGQYGNAALAGHRTTYGAPFEDLDNLKPGDRLYVDTLLGQHYEYIVDSSIIIKPTDTWVLAQPDDPTAATLTLTTCHPKRSTRQRLVIFSHLDTNPAVSSAPGEHTSNYQPVTTTAAPTTVAPTTIPPTTLPGATTTPAPPTTASPVTTAVPTTVAELPGEPPGDEEAVDASDAQDLARGWFHDNAAWFHIIGWGLVLTAICLMAWRLGRKVGHSWVAYAAGFAPFIVGLYFFFQNLNRLLPPGL